MTTSQLQGCIGRDLQARPFRVGGGSDGAPLPNVPANSQYRRHESVRCRQHVIRTANQSDHMVLSTRHTSQYSRGPGNNHGCQRRAEPASLATQGDCQKTEQRSGGSGNPSNHVALSPPLSVELAVSTDRTTSAMEITRLSSTPPIR